MGTGTRYDLVVFDFDGTLCDSAGVKTAAFYLLYLDEQGEEFARRVREYHLANAGVSRFDKIAYVERVMLDREPSQERIREVADRFGSIVEEQVVAAPLFDGVREFLERWIGRLPLTVASATPTDELRRIVSAKGLERFFSSVEGSPRSKGDILAGYLTRFAVEPSRALMVGDQQSDLDAARRAGTAFALFGPDQSLQVEAEHTLADFAELHSVIGAGHPGHGGHGATGRDTAAR